MGEQAIEQAVGKAATISFDGTRCIHARRCVLSQPGVFKADAAWGLSALVLIATGLARAFGGFEKGAAYYLHAPLFHLKMTALVLILLLEIVPMLGLIRWRIAARQQQMPDLGRARTYVRIGHWQAMLVMVIVFAASGMARGIGAAG